MEKDVILNVDRKEKCVLLLDCCFGLELRDFFGRLMGYILKDVDENDSYEGED